MYTQSGDASPTWATAPKELARKRAFTFGGLVGCEHDTSEELLECLQNNLDVDTIIKNQSNEVCVCFFYQEKNMCIIEIFFQFETVVCHERLFKCVSCVDRLCTS